MKKSLMTFLFLFSSVLKGLRPYRQSTMELARLKASLMYVKSVETFRMLFVSLLGIGISLVFLLSSLILFSIVLLTYTSWTTEVKMYVGFSCAAVYFLTAFFMFSYIFSADKWLKIFHAEGIVDKLSNGSLARKATEDAAKNNSQSRPYSSSQ